MDDALSRDQVKEAIEAVLQRLEASADELGDLDSAVGDGDLGVTVTLGCRGVRKALPDLAQEDIGMMVARSGMAFNTAAASTIGALISLGAMRAGKEATGLQEIDGQTLARMVRAAELGIKEQGKAQRGDKTLLDALGPGADAIEAAVAEGKGLTVAMAGAAAAARAGVEATKPLKARAGRASWFADRTAGHADPGATLVLRIFEALADYLDRRNK